jgi:hypothetical protein
LGGFLPAADAEATLGRLRICRVPPMVAAAPEEGS